MNQATENINTEDYSYINGLFKDPDCQHCGDEWEYQCLECEKKEEIK